ncbi:hypothetical protein VTO42DRAFT_7440 [Malbranchea cinnamomea]
MRKSKPSLIRIQTKHTFATVPFDIHIQRSFVQCPVGGGEAPRAQQTINFHTVKSIVKFIDGILILRTNYQENIITENVYSQKAKNKR